jgi:pimeloyl-ACP methyl ester carboxylesterase
MKRGKGTKILCGVGIAAAALYCVNRLAFLLSTRKNILQGGDQSSFSWRFGNIYYTKKGKGDPILLLHGMETGSSAHEWKSMMGTLAESRTVYAIDLPGYGRSDKERMLYTNYLYVDAVTAFVKKVIGTKTDIVTSGASSSIAVMAAASNPDLFGSLVMITPESPDEMIKSPRPSQIALSKLMMLPLIGTFAYVLASSRLVIDQTLGQMDLGRTDRDRDEMAAASWEGAHLGGPDARFQFLSRLGAYTKINVIFALKKLTNPICIIYGSEDPNAEKTLEVYKHFSPMIRSVKIQNAKKRPHLAHPGRIAAFCGEFIRGNDPGEDRSYIRIFH